MSNLNSSSNQSTKISGLKGGKATSMADLMKSVKTNFVSLNKGDVVEGTVKKLGPEITVEVGSKTDAVVLEKDRRILKSLLGALKVGDKVNVYVLTPESEYGYPLVSLRKFNEGRVWEKLEDLLKNKTQVDVSIDESTKGGYIASTTDGISGFLPNSQVSFLEGNQSLQGKTIKVCVTELNRETKKVIFSQKATMQAADFEKMAKNFKKGDKVEAVISNIAPFGIFVTLGSDGQKLEGFIHISEVAWEKLESIPSNFKPADKIEVLVLGLDRDAKRINLSIKRLTTNPYEEKLKEFTKDLKINAKIVRVADSGMILDLGEGMEGFIKKEKMPPTVTYVAGQEIEATVLEVDRNQRIILAPVLKVKPIGYR